MLSPSYSISPNDLWNAIATHAAPQIVDVRRREAYAQSMQLMPATHWRDAAAALQWSGDFDRARPLVIACKAGHEMSQWTVAQLRGDGFDACVLEGGYEGWAKAGLPFVAKPELDRLAPKRPSVWVTRRRPKLDRVACPWLIRRFLDPQARILFVDSDQVQNVARESGAVPFDIKDVDLAPEAAGLHAIALGQSVLAGDDDHALLERGFMIYDALFAWLRFAADERHNWPVKAA